MENIGAATNMALGVKNTDCEVFIHNVGFHFNDIDYDPLIGQGKSVNIIRVGLLL
jgi:hypothetical protein